MTKRKEPRHIIRIGDDLQSVELAVNPDEEWIKFATHYDDIFSRHCIGYWARGMEWDKKLGWLAYEHGDERRPPETTNEDILVKWRKGEKLPRYWFRIDRAAALRAQAEGIKLKGLDWYGASDTDATFYDCIIQRVIFGEEKYG